jgi:hypothetical protein
VENRWNSCGKLVVRGKIAVTCYLFGAAPKNAERVALWIRPCPSNLSERFWTGPFSSSDRSFCQSIAARVPRRPPRFSSKFGQSLPLAFFCLQASSMYEHLSLSKFAFASSWLWSPEFPQTLYLLLLKKFDLDQIAFSDHTTILAS